MSGQLAPPATAAQALAELRELLASDGYAVTFLSMGEYRAALLRTASEYARRFPAHDSAPIPG